MEKGEEFDDTVYTEVDFSWPLEITRRAKNLIKEYKVVQRAIRIKKSNKKKSSDKSNKNPPA